MTRYDDDEEFIDRVRRNVIKGVLWTLFAVILLIVIFGTFYTVQAGERGVLLTFGKPDMVAKSEGLHLKIPIAQTVVKYEVKTLKFQVDAASASKDLQDVHTTIALNYHLSPDSVPTLHKEIGVAYEERVISPLIQEVVKSVTARFTAEELITRRSEVKDEMFAELKDRLAKSFIYVDDMNIVNFQFSEQFTQAIESKVTNEQLALAEKNKVLQIQYQAEQLVAQAEGNKKALILDAQGKAESIRIQSLAIREQGGIEYIQLQSIQKWDGKLPIYMTDGAPLPFLNIPNVAE